MLNKHSNWSVRVGGYTLGAMGLEKDISKKFHRKNPNRTLSEVDPDAPAAKNNEVFPDLDLDLLDFFFSDKLSGFASPLFD